MLTIVVALLLLTIIWVFIFSISGDNIPNKFRCPSVHTWLRNEKGELYCGFCGYNPSKDED